MLGTPVAGLGRPPPAQSHLLNSSGEQHLKLSAQEALDRSQFSSLDLLVVALLIAVIFVSIVGNCLVCIAIFTDRRLRKLGNAFIVSLAIADLFVSCLVMTFALCNDLMNYWIFGDWFCDVWISFDIMCSTASILNLCAISLDRFIHIKDCLLYNQWMTRRVALSAVVIIWFISALVSFVPINLGWHKPGAEAGRPARLAQASPSPAEDKQALAGALKGRARREEPHQQQVNKRQKPATLGSLSASPPPARRLPVAKLNYSPARTREEEESKAFEEQPLGLHANTEAQIIVSALDGPPRERINPHPTPAIENQSSLGGSPQARSEESLRTRRADFVTSTSSRYSSDEAPAGSSSGSLRLETDAAGGNAAGAHRQSTLIRRRGQPNGSQQFNQVESSPRAGSQAARLAATQNWSGSLASPATDFGFVFSLAPEASGEPADGVALAALPLALVQNPPANAPILHQPQPPANQLPSCTLNLTPTYAIISSSISFYIPCIIMLGLYTKLFACARKHVRNIQAISKAPAPISLAPSRASSLEAPASGPNSQPAPLKRTWLKLGKNFQLKNKTNNAQQPQRAHNQSDKAQASASARLLGPTRSLEEDPAGARVTFEARPARAEQAGQESAPFLAKVQGAQSNKLSRALEGQANRRHQSVAKAQSMAAFDSSAHSPHLHHCHHLQQQQQQQSRQLATHKAAITLGIIMGTFLFCWVPFFCLNIIKAFCCECIDASVFRAFTWLGYANSALNPIIYGIHNSEFRQAFNRIFFKHLNFKNSRYYPARRLSYEVRNDNRNNISARLKLSSSTNRPKPTGSLDQPGRLQTLSSPTDKTINTSSEPKKPDSAPARPSQRAGSPAKSSSLAS